MKKALFIMLCLATMISLASCQNRPEDELSEAQESESASQSSAQIPSSSQVDEASKPEEPEPAENPAAGVEGTPGENPAAGVEGDPGANPAAGVEGEGGENPAAGVAGDLPENPTGYTVPAGQKLIMQPYGADDTYSIQDMITAGGDDASTITGIVIKNTSTGVSKSFTDSENISVIYGLLGNIMVDAEHLPDPGSFEFGEVGDIVLTIGFNDDTAAVFDMKQDYFIVNTSSSVNAYASGSSYSSLANYIA